MRNPHPIGIHPKANAPNINSVRMGRSEVFFGYPVRIANIIDAIQYTTNTHTHMLEVYNETDRRGFVSSDDL